MAGALAQPHHRSCTTRAALLLAIVWVAAAAAAARAQPTASPATAAAGANLTPTRWQDQPGDAALSLEAWLNATVAQQAASAGGGALSTPDCQGLLLALRACAAAAAAVSTNNSSSCSNTSSNASQPATSEGCCPRQCTSAANTTLNAAAGPGCLRAVIDALCNATAANSTRGLQLEPPPAAVLLQRCLSGPNATTCAQPSQPGSPWDPQMAAARALQNASAAGSDRGAAAGGVLASPLVLAPLAPSARPLLAPPPPPVPATTLYSAAAPDPFQLLPSGAAAQVVLASPDEIAREARRSRPRRLLARAVNPGS